MVGLGSSRASYEIVGVVRGHLIYKVIWIPEVGEVLQLRTEDGNEHDEHAVAVIKDGHCGTCTTFHVTLVFPEAMK